MARLFLVATSDYLYALSAPVTGYPLTMASWFLDDSPDTSGGIMSVGTWGSADNFSINSHSAERLQAMVTVDGSTEYANTGGGTITNDIWHHGIGVFASSIDRRVYLDGSGTTGQNTDDVTPATPDRTTIGSQIADGSYGRGRMSGYVAETAIWNVELTLPEIDILAAGYSPLFVRPQNLVLYVPLVRDNDMDLIGGLSFANDIPPGIVAHPRVIYPAPPIFWSIPSAVGEYFQSATGILTPAGIISKETSKAFAGSSTLVGSIIKQGQKAFTGSTTASGVLVGRAGKVLTGSITASGVLVRSTVKLFTGSMSAVGTLVKQTAKSFTGSMTASGVLGTVKAVLLSIGGSLAPSGTLVRQTRKILAGSLTASGSLIRQTFKAFVGAVTAVGSLATQKIIEGFTQVVGGVVTMTGSLVRMIGKQTAGILTMTGSITKRISKTFTGVLTTVGTLIRQILGLPVPANRIYSIASENRVFTIVNEPRFYSMVKEKRIFTIHGSYDSLLFPSWIVGTSQVGGADQIT